MNHLARLKEYLYYNARVRARKPQHIEEKLSIKSGKFLLTTQSGSGILYKLSPRDGIHNERSVTAI